MDGPILLLSKKRFYNDWLFIIFVQTFRSSTCGFLTSHHGKSRLSLQGGLTLGAAAASNGDATRAMLIVELPAEILFKILSYMSFKEISYLRMVSQINYNISKIS